MPNFTCPTCKALCSHSTSGVKVYCPRCGQKLLVPAAPAPPQNRTVLGAWRPDVAAPPPEEVVPIFPTVLPAGPRTAARQRPRAKGMRPGWVVGLVLAAVLPLLIMLGGCVLLGVFLPSPDRTPNARCPNCLSTFRISDMDHMTSHQKAAVRRRCPVCGNYDEVVIYEAVMGAGPSQVPAQPRPEDVLVPNK